MTYSIVACDLEQGQLGVAVQTHQMSVGSVVPWVQPGVGAVATQSLTNIHFGPMGLDFLAEGVSPQRVIDALIASDVQADRRQVAVVSPDGQVAAWTGAGCIPFAGHYIGNGYSVQANMMVREGVITAMYTAYEQTHGDLADRMLAAMQAAQHAGGDIRGMQSAAIIVSNRERHDENDVPCRKFIYNLRVDEHEKPLQELGRLVRLRKAQIHSIRGHKLLETGQLNEALAVWQKAREMAPELEEIVFWQAVELAEQETHVEQAALLLREMLATAERADHWLDLIHRLVEVQLFERATAGDELLAQLDVCGCESGKVNPGADE